MIATEQVLKKTQVKKQGNIGVVGQNSGGRGAQEGDGVFCFLGYDFDYVEATAHFYYRGADGAEFHEKVKFQKPRRDYDYRALDRAMFLAFGLIGVSYYKARPTREVLLFDPLDEFQARFFTTVYQEGLGQFAFENGLTRGDLAVFKASAATWGDREGDFSEIEANGEEKLATAATTDRRAEVKDRDEGRSGDVGVNGDSDLGITRGAEVLDHRGKGRLVLQSGGKDSLLTACLMKEKRQSFTPVYVSSTGKYPRVLDELGRKPRIITRQIDLENLRRAGGLNGHVPVTYIVQTLALIQAILDNKNEVITSIGQEGVEPNTQIGDLIVNHQWSKTAEAEKLYNEYTERYVARGLKVRSMLRQYSELEIAELFAKKCWAQYGEKFSSCNVANYRQGAGREELGWCGKCAKCANSYLLFCPFIEAEKQRKLFSGRDLFEDKDLTEIFQGLLGKNGVMKPFECVGSTAELREAYRRRLPGYGIISSNG